MAIINKTGITEGGTIQAEHITRTIDALSGVSTDTIIATGSLSGSLTGTADISGSFKVYNPVDGALTIDSDAYSLQWNGGGSTLNWDSCELYDHNELTSINWNQRSLYNSAGGDPVLDWELRRFTGTASFATSASRAVTASYALNAAGGSGVGFPFTGSARITGSLIVTGSLTVQNALVASGSFVSISAADSFLVTAPETYFTGSGGKGSGTVTFGNKTGLNLQSIDTGVGFVLPLVAPTTPTTGSMFFDYTGPTLYVYDGNNWLGWTNDF